MTLNLSTNTAAAQLAIWTAENPTVTRLIMLALPLALAVAAGVLSQHPVYFMPPSGGGAGCGPC